MRPPPHAPDPLAHLVMPTSPQVGDGNSDFTPSPEESRQIVRAGYMPSATPTLMVQFANDSIDQTPEMLDILRACSGGAGGGVRGRVGM